MGTLSLQCALLKAEKRTQGKVGLTFFMRVRLGKPVSGATGTKFSRSPR